MFHPGSTAVHTFTIPFNKNTISEIIVSYWQNDHIALEKILTSADEDFDNAFLPMKHWPEDEKKHKSKFFVQFKQEESLVFDDCKDLLIQINIITKSNTRHASNAIKQRDVGIQLYRLPIDAEEYIGPNDVITNGQIDALF